MSINSPGSVFEDSFVDPGITGPGVLTDRATGVAAIELADGVATAALQWPALNPGATGVGNATDVWLSFMSDIVWYIIFGVSSVPAPVIGSHTGSTPTQTAIRVPADQPYMRKLSRRSTPDNFFRMIQASGGTSIVTIEQVQPAIFDTNV